MSTLLGMLNAPHSPPPQSAQDHSSPPPHYIELKYSPEQDPTSWEQAHSNLLTHRLLLLRGDEGGHGDGSDGFHTPSPLSSPFSPGSTNSTTSSTQHPADYLLATFPANNNNNSYVIHGQVVMSHDLTTDDHHHHHHDDFLHEEEGCGDEENIGNIENLGQVEKSKRKVGTKGGNIAKRGGRKGGKKTKVKAEGVEKPQKKQRGMRQVNFRKNFALFPNELGQDFSLSKFAYKFAWQSIRTNLITLSNNLSSCIKKMRNWP